MKKVRNTVICMLLALLLVIQAAIPISAKETWPKMPQVEAPSICVMDIATGTVLYERQLSGEYHKDHDGIACHRELFAG